MAITTLQEFIDNYSYNNGEAGNEIVLNRSPERLKKELLVLKEAIDIFLGNGAPLWSASVTYETDQYVTYNDKIYKALLDANLNKVPSSQPTYWEVTEVLSISDVDGNAVAYALALGS